MEENEHPTNRRRFLKQVALTLAAAVGMGALARPASALPGQCCRDCDGCGSCVKDQTPGCYCKCDCSGTGTEDYCIYTEQGCRTQWESCILCGC
jgi:hypothetical protein